MAFSNERMLLSWWSRKVREKYTTVEHRDKDLESNFRRAIIRIAKEDNEDGRPCLYDTMKGKGARTLSQDEFDQFIFPKFYDYMHKKHANICNDKALDEDYYRIMYGDDSEKYWQLRAEQISNEITEQLQESPEGDEDDEYTYIVSDEELNAKVIEMMTEFIFERLDGIFDREKLRHDMELKKCIRHAQGEYISPEMARAIDHLNDYKNYVKIKKKEDSI